MYQGGSAAGGGQPNAGPGDPNASSGQGNASGNNDVSDVEYEEVNDNKK
jgi:hypothetical protein